jgi:hypothetical protein
MTAGQPAAGRAAMHGLAPAGCEMTVMFVLHRKDSIEMTRMPTAAAAAQRAEAQR